MMILPKCFITFLLCFEGFHLFHCALQRPRTLRAQLQAQAGAQQTKKTMEDDRNRESWEYMDIYGNIPYK